MVSLSKTKRQTTKKYDPHKYSLASDYAHSSLRQPPWRSEDAAKVGHGCSYLIILSFLLNNLDSYKLYTEIVILQFISNCPFNTEAINFKINRLFNKLSIEYKKIRIYNVCVVFLKRSSKCFNHSYINCFLFFRIN